MSRGVILPLASCREECSLSTHFGIHLNASTLNLRNHHSGLYLLPDASSRKRCPFRNYSLEAFSITTRLFGTLKGSLFLEVECNAYCV